MIKITKHKNMEFRELLIHLINLLKPDTYVELGTRRAYTFNAVAPLVKTAIGIDMTGKQHIVKRNNVTFYQMKTDDAAPLLKDVKIDFLFIDADHSYEQVKKDFDNFSKYVINGTGYIFLHDTHPVCKELLSKDNCHTAYKFAEEVRKSEEYKKNFEICTIAGPWAGLSIIRKSDRQLSWMTEEDK